MAEILSAVMTFVGRIFTPAVEFVRRGLKRPSLSVTMADFQWHGPSPWADDQILSEIKVRIGITNSSPVSGSVSMVSLEIDGWPAITPEQVMNVPREVDPLLHRRLAYVTDDPRVLSLPIRIARWSSENGWLVFRASTGDGRHLTYADAVSARGWLSWEGTNLRGRARIKPFVRPSAP